MGEVNGYENPKPEMYILDDVASKKEIAWLSLLRMAIYENPVGVLEGAEELSPTSVEHVDDSRPGFTPLEFAVSLQGSRRFDLDITSENAIVNSPEMRSKLKSLNSNVSEQQKKETMRAMRIEYMRGFIARVAAYAVELSSRDVVAKTLPQPRTQKISKPRIPAA